ncbi:Crinkler (CRN) family protein [Thraustotheca clavata]|uniref:Crinkler (CRN) family protein n=1 Tax=Thraustotheca clavata TaxID=74557 RepID=A0A1V9YI83_9STRA|nr:Crinkler (CRN) family protein [Thraustotheca clavata]
MHPSFPINSPLFAFPDTPTAGNIHVLVKVPPVKNDASDQRVEPSSLDKLMTAISDLRDTIEEDRKRKRSVYSISSLNSTHLEDMKRKLNVKPYLIEPEEIEDTSIENYSWIPNVAEDHPLQKTAYLNYIKDNLDSLLNTGRYQVDDAAHDGNLLALSDPRLPFGVKGTTDVIFAKRREKWPPSKLFGACLVIQLKKEIKEKSFHQAMAQLICASIKAPSGSYPVSLLTDLNNKWYFFWFKEVEDIKYLVSMRLNYPKNAFDFIKEIAQAERDKPLKIPFTDQSFKKLKVDDFMQMPADASDELMERYELMSDVLEPEFLMERRREYFLHQVAKSPMFSHMYV